MDWRSRISYTCALTAGLLTYSNIGYSYQARSSAVTEWTAACPGDARGYWDTMCATWRTELGRKGWTQWWANYDLVITPRYADPSLISWGYDNSPSGFDAGTAAILCTHGGYDYIGWWGLMQNEVENDCGISVTQMEMGKLSGGSTRFLHLSSCNSMRWDYTNAWFGPAKGGVHIITGFHGIMYIGSAYVNEYKTMVDDSYTSASIADSWVDNMYHDPALGPTICPISMAFGQTEAAAKSRLSSERYNTQTADTANNFGVLQWVGGCTPDDGGTLPK